MARLNGGKYLIDLSVLGDILLLTDETEYLLPIKSSDIIGNEEWLLSKKEFITKVNLNGVLYALPLDIIDSDGRTYVQFKFLNGEQVYNLFFDKENVYFKYSI